MLLLFFAQIGMLVFPAKHMYTRPLNCRLSHSPKFRQIIHKKHVGKPANFRKLVTLPVVCFQRLMIPCTKTGVQINGTSTEILVPTPTFRMTSAL